MNLWSHCLSQNTNKKLSRFLPSLNRAEILTIFRSYYGRNDDFLNWFWNCLSKPWGRFFQIICASQKVWTLSLCFFIWFKCFFKNLVKSQDYKNKNDPSEFFSLCTQPRPLTFSWTLPPELCSIPDTTHNGVKSFAILYFWLNF